MTGRADVVPIPPGINTGLSVCWGSTMLRLFGSPGSLTDGCSAVGRTVKSLIRYGVDVGPFKVSGLDYAVNSLTQVFAAVARVSPDTYKAVKTVGMLCVRKIKHNPAHFSNHSWGTAIDLYFGTRVLAQGVHVIQRGFLDLAGLFNDHGWYWGVGFSGGAVDSMHFELTDGTVSTQLVGQTAHSTLVADADYSRQMGYDFDYEDV